MILMYCNSAKMFDYAYNRKVKDEIQNIFVKINKSTNATFYYNVALVDLKWDVFLIKVF